MEDLRDEATQVSIKAGVRPDFSLGKECEIQAMVLERLGVRDGAVVGQLPLDEIGAISMLRNPGSNPERTLAHRLYGHNAFEASLLPVMRAMSAKRIWPFILVRDTSAHIRHIPTLELVAALCIRILCLARRMGKAKYRQVCVVCLNSGEALLEASVILHLAVLLGQEVDLTQWPVILKYQGMSIIFMATDSARGVEHTSDGNSEANMFVKAMEADVVLQEVRFSGTPMLVLSDFPDEVVNGSWLASVYEFGGGCLEEICIVQSSTNPYMVRQETLKASFGARPTLLFPKTLSKADYVGRGYTGNMSDEAGLFHAHLLVCSSTRAPLPYLAQQLCHKRGAYAPRMEDSPLQGIHLFRCAGLLHACSASDLEDALPEETLEEMKELLYSTQEPELSGFMRERLTAALEAAKGKARKQIQLLLKYSEPVPGYAYGPPTPAAIRRQLVLMDM